MHRAATGGIFRVHMDRKIYKKNNASTVKHTNVALYSAHVYNEGDNVSD